MRAQLVGQSPAVCVAHVDCGRRRIVTEKQPPLRVEVVLHVAVEVEVVPVEVGEDEHCKPDPVETAQRRAVRGRLHRAAAIARVEHLAEEPLEVDRLRGRPGGGAPLAVDTSLDRPQQSGPAPGRRQHRVEEERRRRLARRARDAGDGQLLVGRPKNSSATTAIAARESETTSCGTCTQAGAGRRARPHRSGSPPRRNRGRRRARPGRRKRATRNRRLVRRTPDRGSSCRRARRLPPARARRSAAPGPRRASLTAGPGPSRRSNRHRSGANAGLFADGHWRAGAVSHYDRRGEEAGETYEEAQPSGAPAAFFSDAGSSGGTSRYWSAKRAMSRNAGAATRPPKI